MKQILLAITALVLAVNSNAQITLTSGSYPASVIGTDTLKATTTTSAFPSFAAMANGIWDLSTVTDTTPIYYVYRVPSATYQFADSNFYSFSTYAYQGNVQSSNTSAGLLEYGVDVKQAGYTLPTGGPNDSLIFPAQSAIYSSARTKIAFPASNLTTWSSAYHFDFNFEISVAIASLSHAPGLVRMYSTETDTVIGWGKMRVKNLAGGASNWYNVLQVKKITTTKDSFFVSGAPASPALLGALGLTQGKITKTYEQNYYRPMEVTPFANVRFTDSTYSTPAKVTTHTQRLVDVGVDEVSKELAVTVYPNPVNGNLVNVTLPVTGGSWSYELINMNGQVLAGGSLSLNGAQASITMPAVIAPGTYSIRINKNGRQYCVKAIDIVR